MRLSCSLRAYHFPLGVAFVFFVLTIYSSVIYEQDRQDFYAAHHEVNGRVVGIRQEPFLCLEIHSCICSEAPDGAPSCTTRQRELTGGLCHKGSRCCRESCYRRSCSPRCIESVERESCQSRRGNCTRVSMDVNYSFSNQVFDYTFREICPIAKSACFNKFLGSLRIQDEVKLYLHEDSPTRPSRSSADHSPDNELLAQVIIYPIFTAFFMITTLIFWKNS